ncbi:MAG: hypothetical protein COA70_03955 [Planctomycetota bacterium]|nr:MAG: hypothetical protein COA70_03955 [Planctomycetota bacterium]
MRVKNQVAGSIILCDYGQVLAAFDRSLCAKEFEKRLGRPIPPAGVRLLEELLGPFEAGAVSPEAFLGELRDPLGFKHSFEEHEFRLAWCSILWPLEETVAIMRKWKARPGVEVHIVTNTDPWRLAYASSHLGLGDLFTAYTASFEDGMVPKGQCSTMWAEARRRAEAKCGHYSPLVIGVDDLEANLKPALDDGTLDHGIVFKDAAQLDQQLQLLHGLADRT